MSALHPRVGAAVAAFRDAERVRLLLERKERALSLAVTWLAAECGDEERAAYERLTQEVLDEFEAKRETAGL